MSRGKAAGVDGLSIDFIKDAGYFLLDKFLANDCNYIPQQEFGKYFNNANPHKKDKTKKTFVL